MDISVNRYADISMLLTLPQQFFLLANQRFKMKPDVSVLAGPTF